jgi:UDPglucose 6-dehydrogenase
MEVNYQQRSNFLKKAVRHLGHNLSGKTISCLGLAFKGDTDDIRESVSIEVVRTLRGMGAKLRVYDPEAMDNAKKVLGDESITYCKDEYDTMKDSSALFILTEWKQFVGIDLDKVKDLLKDAVIFDGRNLLDSKKVEEKGFIYYAVGKRTNGLEKLMKEDSSYLASSALLKNGNGKNGN